MSFFIHTETDLDHAIAQLVGVDPRFGAVLSRAGRPPLRRRPDGFAGLASIVVSQQLSTASAKAIWGRLTAGLRSVRSCRGAARTFGPARPRRTVGTENPHAQGDRKGDRSRRARPSRAGGDAGRRGACGADRGARHRPLDRRHLSSVLPRPWRRLARRRPRVARGGATAARTRDATERRKRWGRSPKRGGRGAGAAACMLWSYYRTTKQREGAPIPATPTERRTNG